MNGYLTRQQLTAIANTKWREIEAEHACASPLSSAFRPNADALGTPMGDERLKAVQRRERIFDRAFRIGGLVILLGIFAMIGASVAQHRDAIDSNTRHHQKARLMVAGTMACVQDTSEGCLVCMHKDITGQALVSNHC